MNAHKSKEGNNDKNQVMKILVYFYILRFFECIFAIFTVIKSAGAFLSMYVGT